MLSVESHACRPLSPDLDHSRSRTDPLALFSKKLTLLQEKETLSETGSCSFEKDQTRGCNRPVCPSVTLQSGDTNGVSARKPNKLTHKNLPAILRLERVENAIAGLQTRVWFSVENRGREVKSTGFMSEVRHLDENSELLLAGKCPFNQQHKELSLSFRPVKLGIVVISLSTFRKDVDAAQFEVEILENNPTICYRDDVNWPVAVTSCKVHGYIWVASSHKVTKFAADATKRETICTVEQTTYINDLTLSRDTEKFAISVCGWETIDEQEVRTQGIKIYDTGGKSLRYINREEIAFEVPVLCIDFISECHLVIADRDVLYMYNVTTWALERKMEVEKMGSISRIKCHNNHYYTVDAASSSVKVYSDIGVLEDTFLVRDELNRPFRGLSGLTLNSEDHVIMCDSVSSKVLIYKDSVLHASIENEWSDLKWPLGVAVNPVGDGVVIADHGNACVSLYKY